MSWNSRRVATTAVTGNLDTNVAGTQEAAGSVNMNQVEPGSLCALVAIEAETNGIVTFVDWQVSDDATTWRDVCNQSQNAAAVAFATGTAGDDAVTTKVVPAPPCIYTFNYARVAIRNTTQTGAATDTYSVIYRYMKPMFLG